MSKTVQFLGMSAAQAGLFTGLPRQCVVDTSAWTLRVQDGITPGGFALLVANNNLTDLLNKALARDALELGSAATHAATDFDPVGAAAAVLVTAEAYTDAKLIVAKAYTDSGVATAEAFATAGDVAERAYANGAFLPFTGGTLSGALIGTTGRFNGGVGVGMVPVNPLDITVNQNSSAFASLKNSGTGTGAAAVFIAQSSAQFMQMGVLSTGYTPSGIFTPNTGYISSSGPMSISCGSATRFSVNGSAAEVARFESDGSFLVGNTTAAGAGGIRAAGSVVAGVSLGVGTAATGVAGSIAAGGAITAVGNIQAFVSDMRLKEEIQPIENAMDKIRQLIGFTFGLNEKGLELAPAETGRHLGVSAQLVQSLFPEAVKEVGDTGFLTVMYDKLVPVLIEAFKDQDHKIRNMQMQIEALAKMVQK